MGFESGSESKKGYGVRILRNVLIPMEDGVKLAADIYLPDSDGVFPALLEYIPYRKDDYSFSRDTVYNDFARRGFAGVRLDIRGTGASGGHAEDEYSLAERRDACRAIEWIAKQRWCNGNVGMWGSSYGGFSAIEVAMMAPPALKAIAPIYASDDRYTDDCHYSGGALRAFYDAGFYGNFMVAMNGLPPYPEISGESWEDIWREHLNRNEPWQVHWLSHQTQDEYWDGPLGRKYDRIKIPTFIVGGWRDGYPNPPLRLFCQLSVPKKLLIGPWAHVRPNEGLPGPRVDLFREMLRWFGHWLRDDENGITVEPPVCVYVQKYDDPRGDRESTSGYWRYETSWPTGRGREFKAFLGADGALSSRPEGIPAGSDSFEHVPTVGINAGLWSGGPTVCLPVDQRDDDAYSLTYTSEPFIDEMEIFGQPVASLDVSSSARVAFFVVRLCDVAPDGTSALICKGVLNATRRESFREPAPLEPGKVYPIRVDLDATCWILGRDHRLRVSIAGSDWPNVWPSPLKAVNSVYRGPGHLSAVTLPIVAPQETALGEPNLVVLPQTAVSGQQPVWRVITDQMKNTVTVITERSTENATQDGRMRFMSGERMEATASSIDPANCSVKGTSRKEIRKQDGEIEVTSTSLLTSTASSLSLDVTLEINRDGREYLRRSWSESFPRYLL